MKAEIIAIGTEILLGDILNTNAQYIARELASIGISVYHQSVVGDNPQRLKEMLQNAFKRADIVITTGGLGPTKDDLSKEVAADYFNKKLKKDEVAMKWINDYFVKRKITVSENNKKQAYLPEDSIPMYNENGTAPGFILNNDNKIIIMLPGPPKEMIPMFNDQVKKYLNNLTNTVLISKVLKICGIGEGHMEEKIKDIIQEQTNPTVAPYAKTGQVNIRITASASSKERALELIKPVKEKIYNRLTDNVYGEDEETLEQVVVDKLLKNKLTIATAESCSGGLLCGQLINVSGVSEILNESIVTYSNNAKKKYLNVNEKTLEKYGAVSEQTAREMAEGIRITADADIGISTTGIAGPSGGTKEKPVGLVYIGVCVKGKTSVKKIQVMGNREKVRTLTVINALDFLRRELIKTIG